MCIPSSWILGRNAKAEPAGFGDSIISGGNDQTRSVGLPDKREMAISPLQAHLQFDSASGDQDDTGSLHSPFAFTWNPWSSRAFGIGATACTDQQAIDSVASILDQRPQ